MILILYSNLQISITLFPAYRVPTQKDTFTVGMFFKDEIYVSLIFSVLFSFTIAN